MATRTAYCLRRLTLVAMVGLILALLGHGQAYAAGPIKIHKPAPDATVSDMVTTSVRIKPEVAQVAFLLDGTLLSSSSSTSFVWNSTLVPNGTHTLSAQAYSSSNQPLGTVSEKVRVSNKRRRPTPTATATRRLSPHRPRRRLRHRLPLQRQPQLPRGLLRRLRPRQQLRLPLQLRPRPRHCTRPRLQRQALALPSRLPLPTRRSAAPCLSTPTTSAPAIGLNRSTSTARMLAILLPARLCSPVPPTPTAFTPSRLPARA